MNTDNNRACAVIGVANSGKTNLAYFIAMSTKHPTRYVLGYPKPLKGFVSLSSLDDLKLIENCVLIIDEFQRYFPVYDRRSNERLLELLQFAEHNRIKLILTTQISQFITKQCEAYISQWAIKQINVNRLKNGSTPSFILKYAIKHPQVTKDFVKIGVSEFIWYNEQATVGENGMLTFPFQDIGKDWATENSDKNVQKTATKLSWEEYL